MQRRAGGLAQRPRQTLESVAMPDTVLDHDPQLSAMLEQVFGPLPADVLARLRGELEWVALPGGATLMTQGDPGDALFMVVSGRLRAYVADDDGRSRMVREMGRGQVIGEMSLFTGEPRSATVLAIRDSMLVRLDRAPFDALLARSPQATLTLVRQVIHRLQTEHRPEHFAAPVTLGILPVSDGVDAAAFAQRLAGALAVHGRVRVVDAAQEDAARAGAGDDPAAGERAVTHWLDELEAAHDFVLLVGDHAPTPWTHRCSRHSDELLLLADPTLPPQVHPTEAACLMIAPPHTEAAQILVLLHGTGVSCPTGTRAWLARRPLTDHVHLRLHEPRDLARLARLVSRTAVGLVLAGGGARGFAHLGVLQALRQRGVEIDCVGGTSMGAVMAALVASDQPPERLVDITRAAFRRNPTGDLNWLPLISLLKGRRLRQTVRDTMHALFGGPVDLEDLWRNCFCVATNYSQAREEVLHRGPLAQALLASVAIPGALPPVVRDGDLLCDGGTFNNFPADAMRQRRGIGTVIGVDLGALPHRPVDYAELPGPWALLRDRLRPRARRRYRLPSLSAYLLNVTILYSVSRRAQAQRLTDVYFNPPLSRVGLLQWRRLDDIVRQGREHAEQVLARPEVAHRLGLGILGP